MKTQTFSPSKYSDYSHSDYSQIEETVAVSNPSQILHPPKTDISVDPAPDAAPDSARHSEPLISHENLLSRRSILETRQYRIDFRALQKVVPPKNAPQVPFPTPQMLGFDLADYQQVVDVLEVDPRTQLIDLTQSDLLAAETYFKTNFPKDYDQKFEPILLTFKQWVVLKTDVERYFDQIHELIQDVHIDNSDALIVVGNLLKLPDQPPEAASFDVADFALLAAGTAVSIVGAFNPAVAIGGELVLFAFSAAIAIENATNSSEWTPTDPEADRIKGLTAIRERLITVSQAADKHAALVKEAVLRDWDRLNTVSRLALLDAQERNQARIAITKTYERQIWRQLLPSQIELRYTGVSPEVVTRLKHKNQNIEAMRSVALSQFSSRAKALIARRIENNPTDPFTVIIARTGRAELRDKHLNRHWNFVLGRFSYQLTRKDRPDQPVEEDLMRRLLSSGITRRDLFENLGLSSNGYPPLKPALNLEPMNDVRYNVYSEPATYGAIEVGNIPYLISVNQATQDLFINRWMPDEMATRLVATLQNVGPILKTFQIRTRTQNGVTHSNSFFLNANPASGGVSIYHLDSHELRDGTILASPKLDWAVATWRESSVYQPFHLNDKTYLLVATPSSGQVWIKHIALEQGTVSVRDAWKTDKWKGSTEYVPLYLNGETYLLVASPEAGLAWIKRVVARGDTVTLQDAWSVSGWNGSTVYVPLSVPNRALFLVATPTTGNVWIKEMVANGRTVRVENRWSTSRWKNSTQFKAFEIGQMSYLAVFSPATGRVWIKRLVDHGKTVSVNPVWATNWEIGAREFLPMMAFNNSKQGPKTVVPHLISPVVERGIAKDLRLDATGDAHDFVRSSGDLFELFPNTNLLLPN